jgi:6-phosphogluconolactonase
MTESTLRVSDDPSGAVAELLAEQAGRGGSIVLTGGGSVRGAYTRAAELEPDWSRVSLWWSDERCVPPEDERSNFRLAREALLDRLARGPEVLRFRGELQPADAAGEYDHALKGIDLDVLILGLGPDAHVASLFPASPQLDVRDRLVTSGPAKLDPLVDRVTMTLPALLSGRRLVFLVTGADKADAVDRAFRRPIADEAPGSLLRAGDVPIEVYLDPRAAGH